MNKVMNTTNHITEGLSKNLSKNLSKVFVLLCAGFLLFAAAAAQAFAQGAKDTENTADKNLRSAARINPSTLAMELSIPLGAYPGRGGNSVPIAYSYSSKVWQMEMFRTWMFNSGTTRDLNAIFAKNSAAGWTSSLQPPRLRYTKSLYDELGYKFTPTFESMMQMPEAPSDYTSLSGFGYDCGCTSPAQAEPGRDGGGSPPADPCQYSCTPRIILFGSNDPQNTSNNAVYRYVVKRFNVIMPDGSSTEFRKDDSLSVLCDAHNPAPTGCLTNSNQNTGGTYLAVDGSARRLEIGEIQADNQTRNVLYMPNGGRYVFSPSTLGIIAPSEYPAEMFIDVNGNKTDYYFDHTQTEKKVVDTMGRPIKDYLPMNGIGQNQAVGTQTFSLNGMDGQAAQGYSVKWDYLKDPACAASSTANCGDSVLEDDAQVLSFLGTDSCVGTETQTYSPALFEGAGIFAERVCGKHTGTTALRFNPVVLSEITLPDGTKYKFRYNIYGEITRIDYPTGGYEQFEYGEIPTISYGEEEVYAQTNRGVVKRWVNFNDGSAAQEWICNVPTESNTVTEPYVIKSTAPDGSRTEKYIYRSSDVLFGFNSVTDGMPYEEKAFDTAGNLRSRALTEWAVKSTPVPFTAATHDPRVKRRVSIIIEGDKALATLSEIDYDENGSSDPTYFSHLNATKSKSYHYKVITNPETANIGTIAAMFGESDLAAVSETDYVYGTEQVNGGQGATADAYKQRGIIGLQSETRALNPANLNDILAKSRVLYDEQGQYYSLDTGSTTTVGYTAPTGTYAHLRGNATTGRTWVKETNSWLETHTQFDNFGNLRKAWDASGIQGKYAETEYSPAYHYAYPTKVIAPAPVVSGGNDFGTTETSKVETTYDLTTGLPLSVTNDAGQTTKTEYDAFLRPKRVFAHNYAAPETQTVYGTPAGGQLSAGERFVKVRKQVDAVNWGEATTWFDGLGRSVKTQSKDSQGDVVVRTEYDGMGRVKRTTNPYRVDAAGNPAETVLWSKPRYDEAGRAVESFAPAPDGQTGASLGITSFDISTITDYTGTVVISTDASGRRSRSITNALGQLLRVDEATATGGTVIADLGAIDDPRQPTYYKYDQYGKMVRVQQGKPGETIQNRYFLYDSLGRLIRVRQPEQETNPALTTTQAIDGNTQWTAGFTYDVLGNVLTAIDAKGVSVTNTYDNLNRVRTRSYAGEAQGQQTPTVYFTYDGKYYGATGYPYQATGNAKGSLTQVRNGISTSQTTVYDVLGRPQTYQQITDGQTYTSSYQYNFAGALETETYPSGRTVRNEFNADGDLSRIYGKANANAIEKTFANSFAYTADGRIEKLKLGSGLWEAAKFNDRLQITELGLGIGTDNLNLWKVNYDYGEIEASGNLNTAKNTGNIAKQTISFQGLANPLVQTYKYDSLYRLTEARETNNNQQTWIQTFGYDRFGNRTNFSQQGGTIPVTQPTIDQNTNRFNPNQGFSYDKNGNVISDATSGATRTFTFNGENKQTEVKDANGTLVGKYFYDGEGKRVKKQTYDQNGQVKEVTVFVYSGGKLVAEYSTAPPPPNPTTNYVATDILQSVRAISNALGQITSRRDFQPFGEELLPDVTFRTSTQKYSSSEDKVRQKFTGYQKDEETNLDFAEARMYENRQGRFTAVDPLLASGKSANPQTFNRYVYVMNRPLMFTDPDGLQAGTWAGKVYTDGSSYHRKPFENSYVYTGDPRYVEANDGFTYSVSRGGYYSIGNTADIHARSENLLMADSRTREQLYSNSFLPSSWIPALQLDPPGYAAASRPSGGRFTISADGETEFRYSQDNQRAFALGVGIIGGLGGALGSSGTPPSIGSSRNFSATNSLEGTNAFRYMTEGEINAIKASGNGRDTGFLRGGNPGQTFFTKDLFKSAGKAQERLSLFTTPTHRVEFQFLTNPVLQRNGTRVLPDFGRTGGGNEFMTTDPVRVRIINAQPLRPPR